jgi:hypothetical protein
LAAFSAIDGLLWARRQSVEAGIPVDLDRIA